MSIGVYYPFPFPPISLLKHMFGKLGQVFEKAKMASDTKGKRRRHKSPCTQFQDDIVRQIGLLMDTPIKSAEKINLIGNLTRMEHCKDCSSTQETVPVETCKRCTNGVSTLASSFNVLLMKNVPHIIEKIFLSLDYASFKNCLKVCNGWEEMLTSEEMNKKSGSVFFYQIRQEHYELEKTIDEKEKNEKKLIKFAKKKNGLVEIVNLLNIGVNPNCHIPPLFRTPLYWAAWNGNTDVTKLLLNAGADPKMENSDGDTPLHWAAKHGYTDVVKLLLDGGADPIQRGRNGETPLFLSSRRGYTEVVKVLLHEGADPDKVKLGGNTPLYGAASHGRTDVVKLLLNAGSDANKVNKPGETPLHWASLNSNTDVVRLLLNAGADANKADDNGRIPLYWAASNGHPDMVKLLLEAGSHPNKANMDGETPEQRASKNGHTEVVKLLHDARAQPKR